MSFSLGASMAFVPIIAPIDGVLRAMSEVCERNDAHASCPNNIIRLGGVALWFSSSFAILSFHSIPSDKFLQFMFSMQMFAVYPVSLSYSLKKSFRFAFVFSVSGLYDVIIRIRSFSMFSAATLILNKHSIQQNSASRMTL